MSLSHKLSSAQILTQFNFQLSFTIQYEIVPQEHETEKKKIHFSPNAIKKEAAQQKRNQIEITSSSS